MSVMTKGVSGEDGSDGAVGGTYCALTNNKVMMGRENGELVVEKLLTDAASGLGAAPENRTVRCQEGREFCYTLWQLDPNNKSQIFILMQGNVRVH